MIVAFNIFISLLMALNSKIPLDVSNINCFEVNSIRPYFDM
jgi:hypothetical protein